MEPKRSITSSKKSDKGAAVVPLEQVARCIRFIRAQKVMIDSDLAILYQVKTGALTRAVRRNLERFPEDFMFQLTEAEFEGLRSQTGISSDWGGRRYLPYAFTEQGIAMLSSVLRSDRAVHVNIQIMRTFVQLRHMLANHTELSRKIAELEQKYDRQFKVVFDAIQRLVAPPEQKLRRPIGLVPPKSRG